MTCSPAPPRRRPFSVPSAEATADCRSERVAAQTSEANPVVHLDRRQGGRIHGVILVRHHGGVSHARG
jgi:hypothetical protein